MTIVNNASVNTECIYVFELVFCFVFKSVVFPRDGRGNVIAIKEIRAQESEVGEA